MKKSTILCAALAAIAFTGCNKDEGNQPTDGRTALIVSSGIQTRAVDNSWEAGDAIGIYMFVNGTTTVAEGATNRKYITTAGGENGTFAPATEDQTIYFPVSETTTCDLVAYYPHATIGGDNLYQVNVSTQTSQPAIDLMAAAKVTGKSKATPQVAFVFEHKLVKLDVIIKGDGASITDEQLAGTTVKITNQQTAGTYNVVTGGNVIPATPTTPADIPLFTTADGLRAEGIVLPNSDTKDMKLTFTVPKLSNQVFEWEIKKAINSQAFEADKKYKYTITIAKAGLGVTSTVTNWEAGNGAGGEEGDAE